MTMFGASTDAFQKQIETADQFYRGFSNLRPLNPNNASEAQAVNLTDALMSDLSMLLDRLHQADARLTSFNDRVSGGEPKQTDLKDVMQEPSCIAERLRRVVDGLRSTTNSIEYELGRLQRIA